VEYLSRLTIFRLINGYQTVSNPANSVSLSLNSLAIGALLEKQKKG